jgi:hypothetical protein
MSTQPNSWADGRRAWDRLAGWRPGQPYGGHTDAGAAPAGDGALAALDDIGVVRRLLERAELAAVRSARRHGRSGSEIATGLGVARQSAWERWRDLDDDTAEPAADRGPAGAVAMAVDEASRSARRSRRNSTVRVPNVVGRTWSDARGRLLSDGLVAVGQDPDAVPLAASGRPHAVVTDQSPESGAKVPPGTRVRLWLDFGGGSAGVREPRRPRPVPRAGRGRAVPSETTSSDRPAG